MGDETESQKEAAFNHALAKAEKVYRRHGDIDGLMIKTNRLTGAITLGVGEDQEDGLYETKALSERGLDGRIYNP